MLAFPPGGSLDGPRKRFRPFLGGWSLEPIAASSSGHVIVQRFDISKRPYNRYAPDATSEWVIFSPEWQGIGRFSLPGAFEVKLFG